MLIAYIDEVGEAGAFISGYRTLRLTGSATFRLCGTGKSVFYLVVFASFL